MNDERFDRRDMGRNENPRQIAGAVTGAASAGVVGAAGLAVLGPVGAVVGALAGAFGGWWVGRGFEHAVEDMDRAESRFRRSNEHAGAHRPYEENRHGFQLGFLAGRNPRYGDVDFDTAEQDLRTAWVHAHLHDDDPVSWDAVRDDARTGFEAARKRT